MNALGARADEHLRDNAIMTLNMITAHDPVGLVDARRCLEVVFPDKKSRPSIRFFWKLKAAGKIPFIKIGRLTFYDPAEVRRALDRKKHGGLDQ